MNKLEAIKAGVEWWCSITTKEAIDYVHKYRRTFPKQDDILFMYLSEHPEITINHEITLFEKCENLWQNLNAVVLLEGKVDYELLKKVLVDNKPSKDDK